MRLHVDAWVVRVLGVEVAVEDGGSGLMRVEDSWQPGDVAGGTRSEGQERLGQETTYLERLAPSVSVRRCTTGRLGSRLCRPLRRRCPCCGNRGGYSLRCLCI